MKAETLQNSEKIESIYSDELMIPYRPILSVLTGSVWAALLLERLRYYYLKNHGQAFYKFKEPCKHPLCRVGDSWIEELDCSRAIFDRALGLIAWRASDRAQSIEALNAEHQSVKWVSYYRDRYHVSWYWVAIEALEKSLIECKNKRPNAKRLKTQNNFKPMYKANHKRSLKQETSLGSTENSRFKQRYIDNSPQDSREALAKTEAILSDFQKNKEEAVVAPLFLMEAFNQTSAKKRQ